MEAGCRIMRGRRMRRSSSSSRSRRGKADLLLAVLCGLQSCLHPLSFAEGFTGQAPSKPLFHPKGRGQYTQQGECTASSSSCRRSPSSFLSRPSSARKRRLSMAEEGPRGDRSDGGESSSSSSSSSSSVRPKKPRNRDLDTMVYLNEVLTEVLVGPRDDKAPIDWLLARRIPSKSRRFFRKMLTNREVSVNGRVSARFIRVKKGMTITMPALEELRIVEGVVLPDDALAGGRGGPAGGGGLGGAGAVGDTAAGATGGSGKGGKGGKGAKPTGKNANKWDGTLGAKSSASASSWAAAAAASSSGMTVSRGDKLAAKDLALDVLFEDEHYVVINKPAGVVVMPCDGAQEGTALHGVWHHLLKSEGQLPKQQKEEGNTVPKWDDVTRARKQQGLLQGIVHRLDKDTSGVLMIAKTLKASSKLSKLFRNRRVAKTYLAVTAGKAVRGQLDIETPMYRRSSGRMATVPKGAEGKTAAIEAKAKPAHTRVLPMASTGATGLSFVQVTLFTGRMHQIRCHLASVNSPILGDTLFGDKEWNKRAEQQGVKRVLLHAHYLELQHPFTGEQLCLTAPIPSDMWGAARGVLERAGQAGPLLHFAQEREGGGGSTEGMSRVKATDEEGPFLVAKSLKLADLI